MAVLDNNDLNLEFNPVIKIKIGDETNMIYILDTSNASNINSNLVSSFNINRIATAGLSNFNIVVDNSNGNNIGRFNHGNIVDFYIDYDDGRLSLNYYNDLTYYLDDDGEGNISNFVALSATNRDWFESDLDGWIVVDEYNGTPRLSSSWSTYGENSMYMEGYAGVDGGMAKVYKDVSTVADITFDCFLYSVDGGQYVTIKNHDTNAVLHTINTLGVQEDVVVNLLGVNNVAIEIGFAGGWETKFYIDNIRYRYDSYDGITTNNLTTNSSLNNSFYYNGTNSYTKLTGANFDMDSSFSLSFWVIPETPAIISGIQGSVKQLSTFQLDTDHLGDFYPDNYLFNRENNNPSISINGHYPGGSSELTTVKFRIGNEYVTIISDEIMNDNPYMITMTYDNGRFTGYVNLSRSEVGITKITSGQPDIYFGRPVSGIVDVNGTFFKGKIGKMSIWNDRVLSYENIMTLYNKSNMLLFDNFFIDNHILRGYVDDVIYNYSDSNGFHIELNGRVLPEFLDKTATVSIVAARGDEAIFSVLKHYDLDIDVEFWNGNIWTTGEYNEETGFVDWNSNIDNFPTKLVNIITQDYKGWTIINTICSELNMDAYISYDMLNNKWLLKLFNKYDLGAISTKELSHYKLETDSLDYGSDKSHGVSNNIFFSSTPKYGKHATFNTENSRVNCPILQNFNNDYAMSVWFNVLPTTSPRNNLLRFGTNLSIRVMREADTSYKLYVKIDSQTHVFNFDTSTSILNNLIVERYKKTVSSVDYIFHKIYLNGNLVKDISISTLALDYGTLSLGSYKLEDFAFFKFDELSGLVANDDFSDRTGTLSGNVSFTSGGLNGNCLTFTDTTTSGEVIVNSPFVVNHNDFSTSLWFNFSTDLPEFDSRPMLKTASGWYNYLNIAQANRFFDSTLFRASVEFMGSSYSQFFFVDGINLNTWHNIIVTRSGINYKIYLDGVKKRESTISSIVGTNFGTNSWSLGRGFMGKLDELQIYPYVLNDDEAIAVYNSGNGGVFNTEGTHFFGNISDVRIYNHELSLLDKQIIYNNGYGNKTGILESDDNLNFGINISHVSDFKYNTADTMNRVKVYGLESDNIILLHTEDDYVSQQGSWTKERVLTNNNLRTPEEVENFAKSELQRLKVEEVNGSLTSIGMASLLPGQVINVSVPNCNINGTYRIQDITHSFDGDFTSNITLSSKPVEFKDLFLEKVNPDELMFKGNNINGMEFAHTVYFTESPSKMSHVGTSEYLGRLRLNTGMTTGQSTSNFVTSAKNITECELRRVENYETDNDVYEVTNNFGNNWETIDATSGIVHKFSSVGNGVGFRVTLNRNTIDAPTPMYEAISLLYK